MPEPAAPTPAAIGRAEQTRQRILEAAFAEFASYGFAGARVDRIAKAAGCNKNLIYIYFDSKEGLFDAVLRGRLGLIAEENPLTPENLPEFAGKTFDFVMANPDIIRLTAWTKLDPDTPDPSTRGDKVSAKVAAVRRAQQNGELTDAWDAEFLMTFVMSLATAWVPAFPYGSAGIDRARIRAQIVAAVAAVVTATPTVD
ncbi:TetR family transcriptional regulator [Gryllotalpicola protaetiae]|uniref:TetR/AcrR family transcriptional regulator n=1 Tax=Gryllotalpicola protaetiae TaxID=2419771 RepID=A0A387BZ66_9MICO|nr:TetR family transcriptional regulator [Gryllotalpicola protaetiae]AYG03621.1 TetR/AcrR family transcriptional regulator [Gryllotalpicola protaetiae]